VEERLAALERAIHAPPRARQEEDDD